MEGNLRMKKKPEASQAVTWWKVFFFLTNFGLVGSPLWRPQKPGTGEGSEALKKSFIIFVLVVPPSPVRLEIGSRKWY